MSLLRLEHNLYARNETDEKAPQIYSTQNPSTSLRPRLETSPPANLREYYQVIVENNLFRPLGWQKPNREPQYILTGTIIDSEGKKARAFIIDQSSNKYYYASVGDKIDGDMLVRIEPNQIHLDRNGETYQVGMSSNLFLGELKLGRRESGAPKGGSKSPLGKATINSSPSQASQAENRGNNRAEFRRLRERLRNATPEERQRLIQQFRNRPGRGGGERGRRIR